jgi:nucleoid-associated protein YgaU
MDDRSSKIFVGLCLLVLVWIGVYWMWEPDANDRPRITFAGPIDEEEQQPAETQTGPVEESIVHIPNKQEPVVQPTIITDLDNHSAPAEVIAPVFAEYTVLEDETMGTIARKIYGSSARWEVIARANPRVDPKRLKVGQMLRIPVDPDNVQGKVVASELTGEEPPSRPSKVVEYFVQSGDSLSRISERFYGSAMHARMIFEYNSGTLSSMDDLQIGQLLRLPPLDETEQPGG